MVLVRKRAFPPRASKNDTNTTHLLLYRLPAPSPRCPQNALHERKWLAFIGLSVIFYLNPIKVVGNFVAPESASWGLASEMCLSVSVVMFLVVALCVAGGVGRDMVTGRPLGFYVPKVNG